jgi:hypothetical protein
VCSVSDLHYASTRRCPARLGIAPKEFKVDDCVRWSDLDEVCEDRSPLVLLHSRHLVHAFEYFFLFDGVAPALLLGTSDLDSLAWNVNWRGDEFTSWFMIQTITSSRVKVKAYVEGL